jgi:hypothetical protein
MNRMKDKKRDAATEQLVARIKLDTRSGSTIARLSGVSQPTVSRLRASQGGRFRRSEAFSKLCSFYGVSPGTAKEWREYNELLRNAIIDAWDGTETHGRALLVVVRGLKGLHGPAHRNVGE